MFAGSVGLMMVASSAWPHRNHKPFLHAVGTILSVAAILWGITYI